MSMMTPPMLSPMPSELKSEENGSNVFKNKGRAADKERRQLVSWGLEQFQKSKNDRWRQERQWYLDLAFYFGQQHVQFKGTDHNFSLYVPAAPYYRVRPVINHIRKIVRRDISRMTFQKPNAYVVPASSEDKDLFAANAAEQIWDSTYRRNHFHRVMRQSAFWTAVCGNGFIKQYWDQHKRDVDNPDIDEGDVCFEAVTPFHIFIPDLKEENLENQPFMIHASMKNPSWVEKFYGITVQGERAKPDVIDESFLNIMGANQNTYKEQAVLLEVIAKPGATNLLPEGGYFTIVDDQLIDGDVGMPYTHNEYCFSKIDSIPTGKFYNESIIVDLIPLQRELNRTRGQIIEAKNRMAKPQLMAEEGSVDVSKITSEPGQVITYRTGFQGPEPIPMQPLPSYVSEELDRINNDMSDISGQHEVSQGQVPPGVTAATAIAYLQEHDESLLSTVFDSIEEAVETTARQTLCMVRDYWTVERTIKTTGIDGSFDAIVFRGSDLRNNTDVHVEGGTALPTSKAAKQAFILDLMKMGAIPMEEGLGVLDMGSINKIYERIQVDVRQVQRENLKMSKVSVEDLQQYMDMWDQQAQMQAPNTVDPETGMPLEAPPIISVNTWDNHQIHIEYHNRYRKSQSFELLPGHVKALFDEHVKQHEEILMMSMMEPAANPLDPTGEEGSMEGAEGGQPPGQPMLPGMEQQPQQPGPEPMPGGEVM